MATANDSFSSQSWGPLDTLQAFPSPLEKPVPYFITAFLLFVFYFSIQQGEQTPRTDLPILNPRHKWDFAGLKIKWDFIFNVRKIVLDRARSHPDEPYQVLTDCGDLTILPPVPFANEIRNHEDLSFDRNFHAHLPGFEPLRESNSEKAVLRHVIRTRLTQFLCKMLLRSSIGTYRIADGSQAKLTSPISDETSLSLNDVFGQDTEWQTMELKNNVLNIVARVSTRVFGGEELCRNKNWLKITSEYARTSFIASEVLRLFPKSLRNIAHKFNPVSRKLQTQVKEAREIINPIVEQRRREKKVALDRGEEEPEYNDCLEWCEDASDEANADPATMQLGLSFAAIHTTSDFVTQVMLDLAKYPDYFEPLRKEITDVIRTDGWSRMGLYKMRLLDSFCKETQRLHPLGIVAMHREATKPITLSNGLELPEGSRIAISCQRMTDPSVYLDPARFDGYRYLRMRETLGAGNDGAAHFVSSSPEHLGFGHGQHACPGRFFAANEVKIILCHLLLKYDWRLAGEVRPTSVNFGFTLEVDPKAKIEIRRRTGDLGLKA
ncbi:Dihydromonacolin L monooxygenase LovA 10 [Colletotrichum chlorophyti]|uniref:Dihydromonacolin L monooxygenase LovA 10 n=1 Tax=Colletotrichum chlorophyti TaxID=708187 RepID=A0A1Q8RXM1_9PEZI|nr:Dihydromonacolin L monooxygenase LovA 10 [Colletotrichum chlorophyti]